MNDTGAEDSTTEYVLADSICDVIRAMRKIIKLFKYSPIRNSILQNEVLQCQKIELQLILDCKTRWNTLISMIDRFIRILDPIKKSLAILKLSCLWKNEYLEISHEILNALKPVCLAVEALSKQDANLLTSEGIISFLFNSLKKQDSLLSKRLLSELKEYISKRRNVVLISLIRFLHNPHVLQENPTDEFFRMSSKIELIKLAKIIMERIFKENYESFNITSSRIDESGVEFDLMASECSLKNELEKAIFIYVAKPKTPNLIGNYSSLTKEFNLHEATCKLTPNLNLLLNALLTIRPTSTQNERNFSIAGNFVSKRRSRLSDKSIDVLCLLKQYFLNNNTNCTEKRL